MTISLLRITDFRNITQLEFEPATRGLNIIHGVNGSGKSSLLESIYYLGHGRSFRTATSARLIKNEAEKFSVFAKLNIQDAVPSECEGSTSLSIGLERSIDGSQRLRLAERSIKNFTEVASFLPIRLINSQSQQLLESGPQLRRKFMDWGLFYQNEQFLKAWCHFERALKQRNALLATQRVSSELDSWTNSLIQHGLTLTRLRDDYISALTPYIKKMANELLPFYEINLSYQQGWDQGNDFAEVLAKAQANDLRFGYTQYGPQRADLIINTHGVHVKQYLSRGQQKLLICAMILAQGLLLTKCTHKPLIYLIDDLPSELDLHSRQRLLSLLTTQETQVFITAIEHDAISGLLSNSYKAPMKVFHVEQGSIETATSWPRDGS